MNFNKSKANSNSIISFRFVYILGMSFLTIINFLISFFSFIISWFCFFTIADKIYNILKKFLTSISTFIFSEKAHIVFYIS